MRATFKVRQDLAYWAGSFGQFLPDEQHVVNGGPKEISEIAAAAQAGALLDVTFDEDALPVADAATETDIVSLGKLNEAMADGRWLEGHLQQAAIDEEVSIIEVGGG